MRFGPVPAADAVGAILAHSMEALNRPHEMQLTYRVPKGTVLTQVHVEDLIAEGHETLTVARLETGDIEENTAAGRLARAIVPAPEGQGIRIAAAGAGRVNLYAETCGVVAVDISAVERLNAANPMITLATVPQYHRVDSGGMIATIKIISYAVPGAALQMAETAGAAALRVLAPIYASATLIETTVTGKEPPKKGREALFGRLHRLGLMLSDRVIVDHACDPLAEAIAKAPGEVVFVLTASATSDPCDVGPRALQQAGGEVTGFGIPVDPGNLLFFGKRGGRPVIGLPGCARSPALNGADWVSERLICGVDLTSADIAAMGVGGLLKEIPTRPMPRRES